jgi:hypothetical protein
VSSPPFSSPARARFRDQSLLLIINVVVCILLPSLRLISSAASLSYSAGTTYDYSSAVFGSENDSVCVTFSGTVSAITRCVMYSPGRLRYQDVCLVVDNLVDPIVETSGTADPDKGSDERWCGLFGLLAVMLMGRVFGGRGAGQLGQRG